MDYSQLIDIQYHKEKYFYLRSCYSISAIYYLNSTIIFQPITGLVLFHISRALSPFFYHHHLVYIPFVLLDCSRTCVTFCFAHVFVTPPIGLSQYISWKITVFFIFHETHLFTIEYFSKFNFVFNRLHSICFTPLISTSTSQHQYFT